MLLYWSRSTSKPRSFEPCCLRAGWGMLSEVHWGSGSSRGWKHGDSTLAIIYSSQQECACYSSCQTTPPSDRNITFKHDLIRGRQKESQWEQQGVIKGFVSSTRYLGLDVLTVKSRQFRTGQPGSQVQCWITKTLLITTKRTTKISNLSSVI